MKSAITALSLATLNLVAACTLTDHLPAKLDPGPEATFMRTLTARGVQIYECRAGKEASQYAWAFVAPDAELFDRHGRHVAHHGIGPYWQAVDGSRVDGRLRAALDSPNAGSIPWLLLDATDTGRYGVLSHATQVQRVNTWGGTAPAWPCTAREAGHQERVPYFAEYRFYASNHRYNIQ
jgi:hypothetical protein